jgi:predicted AAA+ superfamily ATPase
VGDALVAVADQVGGPRADQLRQDAALEAFNLACGLLLCDGRASDDELWELLAAFGPQLDTQLSLATPAALRESGLVERQAGFIDQPSPMFEVLVTADATHGTAHARSYYEHAVELAFAVAAVDLHTSDEELEAIERFRGHLLAGIERMEAHRAAGPPPGPTAVPAKPTGQATAASEVAATAAPAADDPPVRPIDELLAELDDLVGLVDVKREVKLVTNLLRVQQLRKERGLPVVAHSHHLIFTGNPGTGKSTVARLLAQIYRTLGVVSRGHLVETDRSGLVAGFVGQTAPLVVARFDEADGGMLLIDEAYSLVRGGERDFGREAIDTIVKLIEDRRDRIVVVMAGYPGEMGELIDANPGLRSRFPKSIHFPDYSTDELLAILDGLGEKAGYHLDDGGREGARAWLEAVPRERGFGNGRTARNLFEHMVAAQATRLVEVREPTNEQLSIITEADVPEPGTGPLTRASAPIGSV